MGTLKSQQVFYFCMGNQLSNMHNTMGDLYDKFKEPEGWLEIKI